MQCTYTNSKKQDEKDEELKRKDEERASLDIAICVKFMQGERRE